MPYNHKQNVLSASFNKTFPSFSLQYCQTLLTCKKIVILSAREIMFGDAFFDLYDQKYNNIWEWYLPIDEDWSLTNHTSAEC